MGKRKRLSEYEKGQIKAFKEMKLTSRDIAARIGRSKSVVNNFLKKQQEYGLYKGTGAKFKLTRRESRRICRKASNSSFSATDIIKELGLKVSKSTVLRVIKKSKYLKRSRANKKPLLKLIHLYKRRAFARKNMDRDWNKVSYIS